MTDQPASATVYWICRNTLKVGLKLFNRLEIHGAGNVPRTGGCVIASNHVSFLDPPILGCSVSGRPVRFMARDTLFENKIFGGILRGALVIPLSREKGDVGALKKSIALLKEGHCVALFPEGTRSPTGELQAAKGGIGFLLAKAGVQVVPMYIDGSYKAYPKGAHWMRPVKIRSFIGEPIRPEEFAQLGTGREAYEAIGQLVMSRIAELRPK